MRPESPATSIRYARLSLGLAAACVIIGSLMTEHGGPWFAGIAFLLLLISTGIYLRFDLSTTASSIHHHVWDRPLSARGSWAWILAFALTLLYISLYWYPAWLGYNEGRTNSGLVALFDPLSYALKRQPASQWFVYGTLYTIAILLMGIRFLVRFRHQGYQVRRTLSVMGFQLVFAYLLPEFMLRLNLPYNDFKNAWPLNYYFFDGWHISELLANGGIGQFILVWGIALVVVITPLLTYFFGKRWYCSWVCGCGGLAETAGDPFRQLSDKRLISWRIERWSVLGVLVISIGMTAMVLYTFFTGNAKVMFIDSASVRSWYGFLIGAAFSGVIGVGFYPIMGSRVWCRFGCPMAAYLGVLQKYFSRFRITTNGGQCISCGNCSTYCEMGIDVRAYAQKGQNIVRASCVGCGVCSAVCPRGVLKLENGSPKGRINDNPIIIGNDGARLNL
ncbi:MAG: 4Fe-4S binding protein [Flavobacteriales bacterium]|nr:4Fe-4S binding protein [Flavobacteriales bacterium]